MAPKYPPVEDASEWFVAFTNAKRENTTAESLQRRSFSTYVPAMTVTRVRRNKAVAVKRPLFPRYIFVGLARGQNLLGLRQTPGLEGMVRVAGRPVTVEAEMLDGLRAAEAAGVYDFTDDHLAAMAAADRTEAAKALVPGMRVNIVDGPFRSFPGTVAGFLPDARLSVIVRIFGTSQAVPMPLDHLEAAGVQA
jgi:transcriptional antiterminator RfaH